jgi:hypothetical protein
MTKPKIKHHALDLWEMAPVVRIRNALSGTRVGRWIFYTHNAFDLLLERRLILFFVIDGFLVFVGSLVSLETGGRVESIYSSVVVYPTMLFAVPILANVVALERRSGSLDLALATPSTERYFLRRVLPICGFFILQGWILPHIVLLSSGAWGETVNVKLATFLTLHVHIAIVSLLVGAVCLYWGSRLQSTGAVMVASGFSLGLLQKWIFNPLAEVPFGMVHTWLGISVHVLAQTWSLVVLTVATFLFYLYARERLRRPEVMLH